MKKLIFLLAACMAAAPCLADESIPFRAITPFKPGAKCLSVYSVGDVAYWLNHCPYSISVRWDDNAKCQNWSCLEEIPANARSAAAISRFVRWCECQGTLSTCNIPKTGC